jgi:hypothetical protein
MDGQEGIRELTSPKLPSSSPVTKHLPGLACIEARHQSIDRCVHEGLIAFSDAPVEQLG